MIIKLVRHGESQANTREVNPTEVGDCNVHLSPIGREQSIAAGKTIGEHFFANCVMYYSPYMRTQETKDGILVGANVFESDILQYEDLRLREQEFGYGKSHDEVKRERDLRKVHGWMYYRYEGGESPADVYDRTSTFLESMWRQVKKKNATSVLIVTHGMTLRCLVARFLHLRVDQFCSIHNPCNCDIVTIGSKDYISNPVFTCGKWAVEGLRLRDRNDD